MNLEEPATKRFSRWKEPDRKVNLTIKAYRVKTSLPIHFACMPLITAISSFDLFKLFSFFFFLKIL